MRKHIYIPIVVLIVILTSCDNLLDVNPKGEASDVDMTNADGVEQLAIGTYAVLDGVPGTTGGGRWASAVSNWVFGGVTSDDAYKGTVYGDQNPINPLENFTVESQNKYVNDHWVNLYEGINRANTTLEVMANTEDMSAQRKEQLEAEMRFLRAHFYTELTRVHGPVPFIDENTENPATVPNDHLVWPEIEADLKFAMNTLTPDQDQPGRPTSWAAKTYLAYTYMFQQRYADAKPLLEDVYTNGPFSLMPDYQQNYLIAHNNNSESIFEIQYAVNDGSTAWDGANAGPGDSIIGGTFMGGSCFYQPTHSLVSAFRVDINGLPLLSDTFSEDDILPNDRSGETVAYTGPVDPRLDHTVGRPGVPFLDWGIQDISWIRDPGNGGPYLSKKQMFLKSEEGKLSQTTGRTFPNANNYRKFKLSQVILWLAEVEVEIGSLARATELVNEIRNRAKQSDPVTFADGTPAANYDVEPYPTPFPTKEYGREAVRHENRIEFAMEGFRFYDLVRWGIASEVMNNYLEVESTKRAYLSGSNFSEGKNEIWPIPQNQIDTSLDENGESVLTQNPNY